MEKLTPLELKLLEVFKQLRIASNQGAPEPSIYSNVMNVWEPDELSNYTLTRDSLIKKGLIRYAESSNPFLIITTEGYQILWSEKNTESDEVIDEPEAKKPVNQDISEADQKEGIHSDEHGIGQVDGVYLTEKSTDFTIRNTEIKPALRVDFFAELIIRLLKNIKDDESGLLFGIFGNWGRGKTYLWKRVLEKLKVQSSKSKSVEFFPWRYQDTPSIWAYLYETLAEEYLKSNYLIIRYWKYFILNISRRGWWPLISYCISVIVTFIWLKIEFETKMTWLYDLIGYLSFSTFTIFIFIYYKHSHKAKKLISRYLEPVNFKGLLGIQNEIQVEIKLLLNTWVNKGERLVLFVDDLDRCSESRIIEVIDALKVMIDDTEISKRMIVIAAIDDHILNRVIYDKYFSIINNDLSLTQEKKDKELGKLSREYMDKLFLSGIKLPRMTESEQIDFLNKLVDGKIQFRNPDLIDEKMDTMIDSIENDEEKDDNIMRLIPNQSSEIMDYEYELIKKSLNNSVELTPRKIRILYYRYLISKILFDLYMPPGSTIRDEWDKNQSDKSILIELLITYGFLKQPDLLKQIFTKKNNIEITIEKKKYQVDRSLYNALVSICECVIPY